MALDLMYKTKMYFPVDRQFWETAAARYLDNQGGLRAQAHEALADYFEGKWSDGKLWTPKKKTRAITDLSPRMEDRQVGLFCHLCQLINCCFGS